MKHAGLPLAGPVAPRQIHSTRATALKVTLCLFAAATLSSLNLRRLASSKSHSEFQSHSEIDDPASEFKDDVFPFRPLAPWDISTDFPHPRTLTYDVEQGTWLRLDVHPISGDIVFDIVGDLYCLPASAYTQLNNSTQYPEVNGTRATSLLTPTKARPILLGVPHDADPHFSPDGDRLVFKSDAELGVDNIWVMPWTGCNQMDLRPAHTHTHTDSELVTALAAKEHEDQLLAAGVPETASRKQRRLLREGRLHAQRVTNETHNWLSDPRFHPDGSQIIATKWYFSRRSLGAGEGWSYAVPSPSTSTSITPNSGTRLISKTLPFGWPKSVYIEQQIGVEQLLWAGGDRIIYAKNVRDDGGVFAYSKDVHSGIYAIFARNLTTGKTETLVDAFPGGASRPELSRDGRTLAFVRRVRDKEALVLKDLHTGTQHHIWHGLSYDRSTIYAPMGTYPSFAFTPTDDALIIWAAGQIWHVPLGANELGEKVAAQRVCADIGVSGCDYAPTPIPFRATLEIALAETRSQAESVDLVALETADTQRLHAFTQLAVDSRGMYAVFQAAGATYVQATHAGAPEAVKVPVLDPGAAYYSPSFVSVSRADVGEKAPLVIHARWSDTHFTTFEISDLLSGRVYELAGLPMGRYYAPVVSGLGGADGERKIAFVKTGGDLLTGDVVATANPGVYVGEITLPLSSSSDSDIAPITICNLRFIPSEIDTADVIKLRFLEDNANADATLLIQQSDRAFTLGIGAGPDVLGQYTHSTLATGKATAELVVSPAKGNKGWVAFVNLFHVYLAPADAVDPGVPVWSKPGNATKGLARLSLDGGHDVAFSGDGERVFWFLGPYLHSLEISKLGRCTKAIEGDPLNFGIGCVREELTFQEVVVDYPTDVARLKSEARALADASSNTDTDSNADVLVITNAKILTMESGEVDRDLIPRGTVVIKGGVIESVFGDAHMHSDIPRGATVIDAQGGFVIPGFLDVHAHWSGFGNRHPATSWELETFLAYGVTTLHNPSSDNTLGFVERGLVEGGHMIGPRIFHTGDVIYGGSDYSIHQDIADEAEARSALIRIKAEGGPASFSYKNYNLPSRASRQRLLLEARNLSMLCVPEGGMNYDWDLTYITDGMTTIEHNLPVSPLYEDVLTLYALSGTGATPTHIVDYGGVMGEQYLWAHHDVPNDPKLRRFTRHDILDGLSETTSRPMSSFAFFNVSIDIANMVHREHGLSAHIGAHGEPPLGLMYHQEMSYASVGGLTNYEVISAATSSAARTYGLSASLGSLAPGKLADMLIYPPGVNLLEGAIRQTQELQYVMRGGRVWEADTMVEVFPVRGRKQTSPPINAE
ncbi:hypothetical protein BJ138DRAFT_1177560 [Hygrophoropsis aurantiaca]|uniref:Uncharacterized protein n=1 Tax=Hygrophoropsis aurantiaca TaxID=72124 RepID=A0ACB8AMU5_9AGAM|nr:hypothetical protein BJ138DRAFT_1177560 [Hygrophoropsis aurantiaca]